MVTQMITLKLDKKFLRDIDKLVADTNYHNRTEFIRNALREKIEEMELKRDLELIKKLKGSSKRKTTEEEYERVRKEAFEELEASFK